MVRDVALACRSSKSRVDDKEQNTFMSCMKERTCLRAEARCLRPLTKLDLSTVSAELQDFSKTAHTFPEPPRLRYYIVSSFWGSDALFLQARGGLP